MRSLESHLSLTGAMQRDGILPTGVWPSPRARTADEGSLIRFIQNRGGRYTVEPHPSPNIDRADIVWVTVSLPVNGVEAKGEYGGSLRSALFQALEAAWTQVVEAALNDIAVEAIDRVLRRKGSDLVVGADGIVRSKVLNSGDVGA
jgi:hypothetical protein